jgi:modification methylase
LEQFPDAKVILDPFIGSGTVAVACKELGRDYIGIEISQKYCEIAQRRLAQEYLFT